MDAAGLPALPLQCPGGWAVERWVRSTLQIIFGAADPLQQTAHGGDVLGLAGMRGAADRQLGVAHVVRVCHAVGHEWEHLEGLGGGAHVGDQLGIAQPGIQLTSAIDERRRHPMP